MTKEKLNCFPHDKFNPHYAAHTQMVTDSDDDNVFHCNSAEK